MYPGLSLDQAPPILVPFRFFLTAPLFALLASLLLFYYGPELLATRWSVPLLGFTHAITLGFLGMIMCGALFQMLPVVAGSPIRHEQVISICAHLLLTAGVLALVAGFIRGQQLYFQLALPALGGGFAVMVIGVGMSLLRAPRGHDTVRGISLAVIGLVVAVSLGLYLGAAYAWGLPLSRGLVTDLHMSWGLFGWVAMLVVSVAYQVVPMFQMTPEYPVRLRRYLAWILFSLLIFWTIAGVVNQGPGPAIFAKSLIGVALIVFAVMTLVLQSRRRRRLPDVTYDFWRVGAISLIFGVVWWGIGQISNQWAMRSEYELGLAIIFIGGFALSVVNGMLYKIVPFLVWLHLQNRVLADMTLAGAAVPNMKQILPDRRGRMQYRAHLAGLVLIAAALFLPEYLTRLAAIVFFVSYLILFRNLILAFRVYVVENRRITSLSADA